MLLLSCFVVSCLFVKVTVQLEIVEISMLAVFGESIFALFPILMLINPLPCGVVSFSIKSVLHESVKNVIKIAKIDKTLFFI